MIIERLKLFNFKRFETLDIQFNKDLNIFVGDNESGKSTILQAIDIVVRGSRHLIEDIGLERLMNKKAIDRSMELHPRTIDKLPILTIELYLQETADPRMNGKNNSEEKCCDGLRVVCEPDDEYDETIARILSSETSSFPFEYYKITFSKFSGETFNGYNRPMRSIFVDNSTIGSEFAMCQYVKDMFNSALAEDERTLARYEYRASKNNFSNTSLKKYNLRIPGYSFAVKDSLRDNLETSLTIEEGGIDISNKGTGYQCLIKAVLALKQAGNKLDVILLEEPETHLSHLNMKRMIKQIQESEDKQLFVATHSNLICTRLDLRKCIIMNSSAESYVQLNNISDATAKFFMKAPDNNLLQYILSNKVILVEGDAEFMLMDKFCLTALGKSLSSAGIDVIAVDGICFKRYLDIAMVLGIKTAVITDNDGDYKHNIEEKFGDYVSENIGFFADKDSKKYTFEVCVYKDNDSLCTSLFGAHCRSKSIENYMLSNKAECAFTLAADSKNKLVVPQYIQDALRWIES